MLLGAVCFCMPGDTRSSLIGMDGHVLGDGGRQEQRRQDTCASTCAVVESGLTVGLALMVPAPDGTATTSFKYQNICITVMLLDYQWCLSQSLAPCQHYGTPQQSVASTSSQQKPCTGAGSVAISTASAAQVGRLARLHCSGPASH